jgi:hypothetical protein
MRRALFMQQPECKTSRDRINDQVTDLPVLRQVTTALATPQLASLCPQRIATSPDSLTQSAPAGRKYDDQYRDA